MFIEELQNGQTITLEAKIGTETVKFDLEVLDSIPKKHIILTDIVTKNDKIITFRAKGLLVDLFIQLEEKPPMVFKNVQVMLVKEGEEEYRYAISTSLEAKVLNRRQNFRVYIGKDVVVQCGANHSAHDAILKDVSSTGFAITVREREDEEGEIYRVNQIIHTVLNDRIEEISMNYSFQLYGIVVRREEVENGLVVYGCRLNAKVPGLDNYLMIKERIRIKKSRGLS